MLLRQKCVHSALFAYSLIFRHFLMHLHPVSECFFVLSAGKCIFPEPFFLTSCQIAFFLLHFFSCCSVRISIWAEDMFIWRKITRKVPAMPVRLMPMLLGEFATPPDRTVSDISIIWRVLAKQLCWQSVTAPLRLQLTLCGGFHFSPAVMSDSQCMLLKFRKNLAWWLFDADKYMRYL